MKSKFTSPLLLAFLNVVIHWGHCLYFMLLLLFLLVCRHWALDWIIPAAVFSASRKWMSCSMTPLGLEELGVLTLSLCSGCSMMIVTAECKKHWSSEMNSGRSSWQSWRFVHCCIMKKDALSLFSFNLSCWGIMKDLCLIYHFVCVCVGGGGVGGLHYCLFVLG